MSVASIADRDDDPAPRPPFGRRPPAPPPRLGRGMDLAVPDLRRRIDASTPARRGRLPWALSGALILGLSLLLWANAVEVASVLARNFPGMF